MSHPATAVAPNPSSLGSRRAAGAVTLMFVVNGMLLGGYGGALPSLRDKLGLEASQIALMLFIGGAARITSMQIGGRLADAIGARKITLAALPVLIAAVVVIGFAPNYPIAIVGGVLVGLGHGARDLSHDARGARERDPSLADDGSQRRRVCPRSSQPR